MWPKSCPDTVLRGSVLQVLRSNMCDMFSDGADAAVNVLGKSCDVQTRGAAGPSRGQASQSRTAASVRTSRSRTISIGPQ